MAKIQEAVADTARVAKDKRHKEQVAKLATIKGKNIKTLNANEKDTLLLIMALALGLCDEAGNIL